MQLADFKKISNELVEVSIIPWASYYVLNLNFPDSSLVKFNRSFLINPQLLSGSASPTLYLADNQISINVLEDVQLSGSIFVPDAKMNNITDDLNSKVNLHQSTPTLPLLRPELEILKEYTPIPKDNRVKLLNTSEQRVKNSFREATLILYCNGMDTLKNMDLSNNIILISERHIVIDKSCQLDNIIVHAPTRKEAINKMIWALEECVFEGIKTNIPFQLQIMKDENFLSGNIHTGFLNNFKYKGN